MMSAAGGCFILPMAAKSAEAAAKSLSVVRTFGATRGVD